MMSEPVRSLLFDIAIFDKTLSIFNFRIFASNRSKRTLFSKSQVVCFLFRVCTAPGYLWSLKHSNNFDGQQKMIK